jgi:hypothetical protein
VPRNPWCAGRFSALSSKFVLNDRSEGKRSVATAVISATIGILQLARAVDDRALSDQILKDGIEACLSLARSAAA